MLSSFDDYFVHQTSRPVAVPATTDRNAYDRFWFNGYTDDGSLYLGIGSARYPNLGIQDCGLTIVHDGVQYAFHASRRMPDDPSDMTIGPFRIEILEPMMRLRVVLDDNETGIGADLTWTPRTASFAEDFQLLGRGQINSHMEATRFNQFGHWTGEIRLPDTTIAVEPGRLWGTTDRSWGIRTVVDPASPGAPRQHKGLKFFWAPLHWDDHITHMGVFEDADGHQMHWDGFILPAYDDPDDIPGIEDPGIERLLRVQHDLTFLPGTRRISGARLTLDRVGRDPLVIDLEPLVTARMKGMGYSHPTWGHGHWKGELAMEGESWRLDEVDEMSPENLHVQSVVRATSGDRTGIGVLEQIVVGPYPRYGFTEFLDPAK